MQVLFEADAVGTDPHASLAALCEEHQATPGTEAYATSLISGALEHQNDIDTTIRAAAPQWPMDQMARVDKSVLRVSIFELCYAHRTPAKVVINEAVEIAKEFGGEASGRFVNGVLGHILATAQSGDAE